MAAGVNLLQDCACAMTTSATDLGSGAETFAGSVSFLADKVSVRESSNTADHSPGQQAVAFHRNNKTDWEVTIETKLYSSALLTAVRSNALGKLTLTALTGLGVVMPTSGGLICDVEVDYAGPSTLKWKMKSRGAALTYT